MYYTYVKYFLFHLVIVIRPDLWFFFQNFSFFFFQNCAREEKSYILQIESTLWIKQRRTSDWGLWGPKQLPHPSGFSELSVSQTSAAVVSHHINDLIFTREATWTGFSYPECPTYLIMSCSEAEVSLARERLWGISMFNQRTWNFQNTPGMAKLFPSHFW